MRLIFYLLFLLFSFSFYVEAAYGQTVKSSGNLIFEGVVYGYEFDPSRKLLLKNKQFVMEGILEGVKIKLFKENAIVSTALSGEKGEFSIPLSKGNIYKLEITKEGYDKSILLVNTKDLPQDDLVFESAEFILNSYKGKHLFDQDEPIGTLFYNAEQSFMDFIPNENRIRKSGLFSKKEEADNPVDLMKRSVQKNKKAGSNIVSTIPEKKKSVKKKSQPKSGTDTEAETEPKEEIKIFTDFEFQSVKGLKDLLKGNIYERIEDVKKAKEKLEQDKKLAKSDTEFYFIQQRESLIKAAENELEAALVVINLQKAKIEMQNKTLLLTIGGSLVLVVLFALLFYHYKEKSKLNRLLENKNQKIFESINYASRIQQSLLTGEKEIQKFLPESFIYYRPRDIVSGDFYWFNEINGKLVYAVIDCTGHGVPGAFMSLIANTLLNQIINEKKVISPSEILALLHKGVIKSLRQEESGSLSDDGMEMSICVIDPQNRSVEFAGAMNSLYMVEQNEVNVIRADSRSIGGKSLRPGKEEEVIFSSRNISLAKGATVYMLTDGFMDQFGGDKNKKFNVLNFKTLLLEIQNMSMQEQKETLHKTMEEWRKGYRQIDDILVSGFRI